MQFSTRASVLLSLRLAAQLQSLLAELRDVVEPARPIIHFSKVKNSELILERLLDGSRS